MSSRPIAERNAPGSQPTRPPYVPVRRTFSEFLSTTAETEDFEYWHRYVGRGIERPGWSALLKEPIVVVLGEARSGKTEEFRQQAKRLRREGKTSFFLRLDEFAVGELEDCIDVSADALDAWKRGHEEGVFFLDSVDEARLTNPAALRPVLRKFARVLGPGAIRRAHILVSSRISDWMARAVREALAELRASQRRATQGAPVVGGQDGAQAGDRDTEPPPAYLLDPLDRENAVAIAEGFGARDPNAFWSAVVAGGYEAYATRREILIGSWRAGRRPAP